VKFALCNEIFKEWEIEKQFEVAAEIGFDGLEIAPFTLNDWVQDITQEQKERICSASADTGVAVGGIHWLLAGPTGLHVTDTYSGLQEEDDLPGAIRATGDKLFHYHCNDLNKRAPGWGDVDFRPMLKALLDIGYQGYCSIEVFDFDPDPYEHAEKGLATLKEALADVS